ncbi:MAG: hypothetical protein LBP56_03550 [Odoribacteraceae bacterium]|nr:hypothetical protein [Odoribacteraceae bacterium]
MALFKAFVRSWLLVLLGLPFSCQEDGQENSLAVALSASECTGSAGSIMLTITTQGDWEVNVSDSWLLPETSKGRGDAAVKLIVAVNRSASERSAIVTVKGKKSSEEFVVKQQGALFTITPSTITFPEVASPRTLSIVSTQGWKVRNAVDASWCQFSQTEGTGDAVITLTPAPLVDKSTPRGPVEIVIESGSLSKRLSLKQEFSIVSTYHEEGEVVVVRQGTVANPIKIAVLGDGFTREDYKHGGAFDQAIGKMMDGFFNAEPFKTYAKYFSVYKVVAYSNERGATIEKDVTTGGKPPKQTRDTRFKALLRGGSSAHVSTLNDTVFAWAERVPGFKKDRDGIFVLVNVDAWAGVTTSWTSGRFIARTCYDANVVGRMLHEGGGHGFGRLKDEYIDHETTIPDSIKNVINTRQANGWWQYAGNVDLTGNLDQVHWKHYFTLTGYSRVNLVEGSCLYRYGAWRPESLSIMEKSSYLYFNAPSREAIVRRVLDRVGEIFNFNDFLAKDSNVLPTQASTTRGVWAPEVLAEPEEL